jgi:hypothetical protein
MKQKTRSPQKSSFSPTASSAGQAMLPVLFIVMAVIILGATGLQLGLGGLVVSRSSLEGEKVLVAAEGALESGMLRLLRQPNYIGETLQVNGLDCTIEAVGSLPIVVSGICRSDTAKRGLSAEVAFVQGEMIVSDYGEIP